MVAPQIAYVVAAQGRQPAAYRRSNQCPELQSGRCTQPIQAVKPLSTRPSNRPCHGQHETSGHNQGYPRRARKGSSPLHPPPTQGPQETLSANISRLLHELARSSHVTQGWKSPATSKQPRTPRRAPGGARMNPLPHPPATTKVCSSTTRTDSLSFTDSPPPLFTKVEVSPASASLENKPPQMICK